MNYVEIDKNSILSEIGGAEQVIICDFDTLRMMDCKNMNMSAIKSFMAKDNAKFYKGVNNE